MRKFILGFVSMIAAVGFAGAADAQQMFNGPPVNWSGPYAGVEGGYGWGESRHTDSGGFDSGSFSANGGMAGGTAGYNFQSGPLVYGIEGDMSWADMSGKTGNCSGACGTRLSDLGTVRGRLGYSFGQIMPYATGGLAFGDVHGDEGPIAGGAQGAGNTYRLGWTAGAGVEDCVHAALERQARISPCRSRQRAGIRRRPRGWRHDGGACQIPKRHRARRHQL